jgi:serine/threonine-protein kinase
MSEAPPNAPAIAGYRLDELVSKSPFSEVWRGIRLADERDVAVKIALADAGARMLRAEAALLQGKLRGASGLPEVLAFADGDCPHLVLPWLGDSSLRDRMRDVRSEDERARVLGLFLGVVATVHRVHFEGFVHGDLKPENVVIDARGEPVLLDFGLAQVAQKERLGTKLSQSMRTEDGLTGGTLAYLPPEAVKGAEPSRAGDVYALGVMLHEILVGRRPDKAVSPEALRRLLDEAVVEILLKALAFDPGDRYSSARGLADDLSAVEGTLLASGVKRRAIAVKRYALAAAAAFFVALRYGTVAVLVLFYASIPLSCLVMWNPAPLLGFLPIAVFHAFVRWEGPETNAEAQLRGQRQVVAARPRR